MNRWSVCFWLVVLGIVAQILCVTLDSEPAIASSPCVQRIFQGVGYVVCTVDLRANIVRLYWKDDQQVPYGGFDHLPRRIQDAPILFAMNAGMYEKDLSPVGLYVENGKTLKPVNQRSGSGNFYLKPNGVLYINGQNAGIQTTDRFLSAQPPVDFATQSGPMLVIDGRTNLRIKPGSVSAKIRNGVGIQDQHTLVFVISEQPVSFWNFAQLFRVALHSKNALFLDGSISSLYAPALRRRDTIYPIGPIVAAYLRR